jgi:hypothetical protein
VVARGEGGGGGGGGGGLEEFYYHFSKPGFSTSKMNNSRKVFTSPLPYEI